MTQITIDPNKLNKIKDEVFARLVNANTEQAVSSVLSEYARENIFRVVGTPQILTEKDANGDVWVGNDYIRVKVHYDTFISDVETEIASDI